MRFKNVVFTMLIMFGCAEVDTFIDPGAPAPGNPDSASGAAIDSDTLRGGDTGSEENDTETEQETVTGLSSDSEVDVDSETVGDSEVEPDSASVDEFDSETDTVIAPDTIPDADSETETQTEAETESETNPPEDTETDSPSDTEEPTDPGTCANPLINFVWEGGSNPGWFTTGVAYRWKITNYDSQNLSWNGKWHANFHDYPYLVGKYDEALVSPMFDLTGCSSAELAFQFYFVDYETKNEIGDNIFTVECTTDGAEWHIIDTWHNEIGPSGGSTNGLISRSGDMSPCTGSSDARLRLRMRGSDTSQLFDCDVSELAITAR